MSQHVHLVAGQPLFRQGDDGDDAYIIVRGRMRISAYRRGIESILNEVGPGEMLGELAIIDGAPRTATATAIEPTELWVVTNAQIAERISRADPVLALLIQQVIRHLRREIHESVAPIDHSPTIERMRFEGELSEAGERNELVLWYQPIVDLKARRVAGFEALVRWQHPTRGLIFPGDFIPLAEESGLIVPIGAWVMRQGALALTAIDEAMGDGEERFMSVNVSGRQLEQPGFLEEVRGAISDAGLSAGRLHLEMTEGVLIQSSTARDTVRACTRIGVGLFLDDFGTGYSSLAYLNQLPFDALKIDHSFAMKLEEEGDGQKLILAILGLARTLGRGVVMEGLETKGQRDLYLSMGGSLGQGYLFGRPMPFEDAIALLRRSEELPWR